MLRAGGGAASAGEGYANHGLIFQPGMVNQSASASQPQPAVTGAESSGAHGSGPPSRYESQKRRDWNTFGQYLRNHRPPLVLAKCSGAHVLEFLRYLDQFGKTKVHVVGCPYYGHPQPPAACGCPLRQAWGSLDALIGRLRAAFEEHGGKPESNPFGARAVRLYLREVREMQAKARGIAYEKKKRKKPPPSTITNSNPNNHANQNPNSSSNNNNNNNNNYQHTHNSSTHNNYNHHNLNQNHSPSSHNNSNNYHHNNLHQNPNSTSNSNASTSISSSSSLHVMGSSSSNSIIGLPPSSSSSSSTNNNNNNNSNLAHTPHQLLQIPHFLPPSSLHQSFH